MKHKIQKNIFSGILKSASKEKATESTVSVVHKCTNCHEKIDPSAIYLQFTGEYLHIDCFIDYMQKIRILKIIQPQKNGDKKQ